MKQNLRAAPTTPTVTVTSVVAQELSRTEWVDVKRGTSTNQQGSDLVEIFGDVAAGDQVALRGTDELRAGTRVKATVAQVASK